MNLGGPKRRCGQWAGTVLLGFVIGAIIYLLFADLAAAQDTCASASLRHEAPSDWAGYSCADIDDLVAASDTLEASARNINEKWSDLGLAFIAVLLAALAALFAQAVTRSVISLVDSMRSSGDSPFYLGQFHALTKKLTKRRASPAVQSKDNGPSPPTQAAPLASQDDAHVLRAMATVIAGGAVTRALYALVFGLIYYALLTG